MTLRLASMLVLFLATTVLRAQTVGAPLPPWQPGTLDIHVVNTGRGDAALFLLPDGTTMHFDAGDGGAPVGSPRGVPVVPDTSRPIGEWLARYAARVMRHYRTPGIDYALLSHRRDSGSACGTDRA